MKFSIRDLLLVTVIVALAVGWWVDRSRLAAECNQLNEKWLDLNDPDAIYYRVEFESLPNSSALATNPRKE